MKVALNIHEVNTNMLLGRGLGMLQEFAADPNVYISPNYNVFLHFLV